MARRTPDDWIRAASPLYHGGREIEIIRSPKLKTWAATDGGNKIWWHPKQRDIELLNRLRHEELHCFTDQFGWYERLGKKQEHLLVYQLAAWDTENFIRNPKWIECLRRLAGRKK